MKIETLALAGIATMAFMGATTLSHAEEIMTTDEHIQEYVKGTPAKYGKTHATDIGNVVHHEDVSATAADKAKSAPAVEQKKDAKPHHGHAHAKPADQQESK